MADNGTKLPGFFAAQKLSDHPLKTEPAHECMPTGAFADRIRRWGLVPTAEWVFEEDGTRYIELSLTKIGAKKPPSYASVLHTIINQKHLGHTFRSVAPASLVITPERAEELWKSVARVCAEKFLFRTLQPVTTSKEEAVLEREVTRVMNRIAGSMGLPTAYLFGNVSAK